MLQMQKKVRAARVGQSGTVKLCENAEEKRAGAMLGKGHNLGCGLWKLFLQD